MAGRAQAVTNGKDLEVAVSRLGIRLGLRVDGQVKVARRLWGAVRFVDVVLTDERTGRSLGIECKFQGGAGTAEEKLPATIQDIGAWPIPGILVFAGGGFSTHMTSYLYSTGKAVALDDLESWLRLYFGLSGPTR